MLVRAAVNVYLCVACCNSYFQAFWSAVHAQPPAHGCKKPPYWSRRPDPVAHPCAWHGMLVGCFWDISGTQDDSDTGCPERIPSVHPAVVLTASFRKPSHMRPKFSDIKNSFRILDVHVPPIQGQLGTPIGCVGLCRDPIGCPASFVDI